MWSGQIIPTEGFAPSLEESLFMDQKLHPLFAMKRPRMSACALLRSSVCALGYQFLLLARAVVGRVEKEFSF